MSAGVFFAILLATALGLSLAMALAWLAWRRTHNSGWVDVAWTFGVGLVSIAIILALQRAGLAVSSRAFLVAGLVALWALRLGGHIARRTRAITDDPRYAKLIAGWGSAAASRMFWLLQKQAWASIPLVLAIVLAAANPVAQLRPQDGLGALILLAAIIGEAVADRQLRRFRATAASGDVCRAGLWSWSRHPNYFFQWLGWLAYPLIAVVPGYAWGWLALLAPLAMYWLLTRISGIPPLEEHMLATRGARYRAYMDRTSAFFPWPPRQAAS